MTSNSLRLTRSPFLLAVLLLAIASPIVLITWKSDKRTALADLQADAGNLARAVVSEQRHRLNAARQLLITLSKVPEIRKGDWAASTRFLVDVHAAQPEYLEFAIASGNGKRLAGSSTPETPDSLAGRSEVRDALATRAFAAGPYRKEPVSGRALLPCALAVAAEDGAVTVLMAALDLAWMADAQKGLDLPEDAAVLVIDGEGAILWPADSQPKSPELVDFMRQGGDKTADVAGLDGAPRLTACAAYAGAGGPGGFVGVGLSRGSLFAAADQALFRNSVALGGGIALLLALIASGVWGRRRDEAPAPEPQTARPDPLQPALPTPKQADPRVTTDAHEQVKKVQHQTRTIALLNEMAELLHSCTTLEEACAAIARSAALFFPDTAGAVLLAGENPGEVQVATVWGDAPPLRVGDRLARESCNALGQGRPHRVEKMGAGKVCKHLTEPLPFSSLCIPMVARGQEVGLLHLCIPWRPGNPTTTLNETREALGVKLADHIASSLSDLKLRETLRTQSIRDSLTGLFNRRHLEERLEEEVNRGERRGRPFGLILMDLDHFKRFNDTWGHDAGDTMLRALADFLRSQFRETDIICRYGGEEFTVILPEATLEDTLARAEGLRSKVRNVQVSYQGQTLGNVTLSLGVAEYPMHGRRPDALLRASDAALYRAKHGGRDRVEIAQAESPAAPTDPALVPG